MPDRSNDKFLSREVGSNEPYEGQIDGEIFAIRSGSSVFGIAGADGQAEAARQEAEAARQAAEEQRAAAQQSNDAAQDANDSAQQSNDTAQTANDAAQAKNNADQAANNQAAQGLQVVILTDGQYDPETREPTGTGNAGYMYFVPAEGDTEDTYVEWMWINSAWERVGMTNATLDPITTDQIDAVASDQSPTGDQTLNTTGLSYLWTKLKAAFSAIGHKHAAEDVTSGTLPIERGGTAASTAEGALTSLGAASATDLEELRESLSQELLWEGSFNSGSITVPGISRYSLFSAWFRYGQITFPVLCSRVNPSASNFYGAAPWFSSTQQLMVFYVAFALYEGDELRSTKGEISRFYINTSDWSHGIDNDATIEAITGLI